MNQSNLGGPLLFKNVPVGTTVHLTGEQVPTTVSTDVLYTPVSSSDSERTWACTKVSRDYVCLWAHSVGEEPKQFTPAPMLFIVQPADRVIVPSFVQQVHLDTHGISQVPGHIRVTASYLSDVLQTASAIMEGLAGDPGWKEVLHLIQEDLSNRNGHMTLYELTAESARALQKAYTTYLSETLGDPDHPEPYLYDVPGAFCQRLLNYFCTTSSVPEDSWIDTAAKETIHTYFNPPPLWQVEVAGTTKVTQIRASTLSDLEARLREDPTFGPNTAAIRSVRRIAD